MLPLIKILIIALIIGGGAYLNEWLKKDLLRDWDAGWIVVIGAIIAAVAIVCADFVYISVGKSLGKPTLVVQTLKRENEVDIKIKIEGRVDRISLNYPLLGAVTNFQDLNPLTDARTVLAKVVGTEEETILSNLQLTVSDVRKDVVLQYKIIYKPLSMSMWVAGSDRYELVYTWEYNGEKMQEIEWRNVSDDNVTTKPPVQVMSAQVFNKALTPEERRKRYEAGPLQRNF